MPLHLYNPLSRRTEPFRPVNPPVVRMCTGVPGDRPPGLLSSMRCAIAADVLRRVLEREGFQVVHVQRVVGGEGTEGWLRTYNAEAAHLNVLRSELYGHLGHPVETGGEQRRPKEGSTYDLYIVDDRAAHSPPRCGAEGSEDTPSHSLARHWVRTARLAWAGRQAPRRPDRAPGLADLMERGYTPLAFRYLCLTGHYRHRLPFAWEAMADAEAALRRLRELVSRLMNSFGSGEQTALSKEGVQRLGRFQECMGNDLDTAGALAVLWEVVRGELPAGDKLRLVSDFDRVLGLGLAQGESQGLPPEALALIREREAARRAKDWSRSDSLRQQIRALSIEVQDTPSGSIYRRLDRPGASTGVKDED